MPTVLEVVEDSSWLPTAYDRARGVIRFGRLSREALAQAPFLDSRIAGQISAQAEFPAHEVISALPVQAPPALIFHSAFCCSTLLARALDAPGAVLALKEPDILLDVANALRVDETLRRDRNGAAQLMLGVLRLLARPARGEGRVVVKPTNAANTLAEFAIAAGAPCLFLYGDLRDYLVSILKKGEEGRHFVRQQFNIYALDPGGLAGIAPRQAMGFTDLQVAALVWRHQLEHFASLLAARPAARIASLYFRTLLADPARVLGAAARHLDLPLTDDHVRGAAASDIFAVDSKFSDKRYDASARDADEAALIERWKSELDLIVNWAAKLNLGVPMKTPLSRALAV